MERLTLAAALDEAHRCLCDAEAWQQESEQRWQQSARRLRYARSILRDARRQQREQQEPLCQWGHWYTDDARQRVLLLEAMEQSQGETVQAARRAVAAARARYAALCRQRHER